jgi:cytochrome c-type biogenesis protein
MSITVGVAFIAGLLSFFTPCVFALVPAFLAYLAGVSITTFKESSGFNKVVFLNTLFYVLGFVLVFTAIGILFNTVLATAGFTIREWLTRLGGIVIVLFGFFLLGVLRIPWLDQEHAIPVRRKASYTTSFLFGAAFAVGWTPCLGAVLGAILTLAAVNATNATALLFAYSAGLAVPFLLTGLFYSSAARFIKLSARYTRIVSIILGILLIILGTMLFFNKLALFGSVPLFIEHL